MEKIKLVEKRVRIPSLQKMVRLQLVFYCFVKDIHLTPGDYSLLTHIAINGYDKKNTPTELVKDGTFLHKQSVRNSRNKLVKEGILVENPKNSFSVNPDLDIRVNDQLLFDYKVLYA